MAPHRGVAALLVRDLALLRPTGGQEGGYRPGTENLPGALALAAALDVERPDLTPLRKRLDEGVRAAGGVVIAEGAERLPAIGSVARPGLSAMAQLVRLDAAGIAVSAGSACASGALSTSPVLVAMGLLPEIADATIRVSFGSASTAAEVDRFLDEWRRLGG